MTKIELMVLIMLNTKSASGPATAMSLTELNATEGLVSYKVNSIYKCIRGLCIKGYVSHGLKDGKADTFYITKYGINKIGEYEV